MDFFGSMEIDPTCEFSLPQSRSEGISFYGFSASPRFHATKTQSGHSSDDLEAPNDWAPQLPAKRRRPEAPNSWLSEGAPPRYETPEEEAVSSVFRSSRWRRTSRPYTPTASECLQFVLFSRSAIERTHMVDFVRSDGGGFLTGSMIAMLVLCAIFFVAGSFN